MQVCTIVSGKRGIASKNPFDRSTTAIKTSVTPRFFEFVHHAKAEPSGLARGQVWPPSEVSIHGPRTSLVPSGATLRAMSRALLRAKLSSRI
jgi:hypothetical protein